MLLWRVFDDDGTWREHGDEFAGGVVVDAEMGECDCVAGIGDVQLLVFIKKKTWII